MPVSEASAEDAPGGFLESPRTAQGRPLLKRSEINSFLPDRGRFTFPKPYRTEAVRLTNPSDCGGSDCVAYVGYSVWRNTNNHVGQDEMLILVGLRRDRGGPGPSIVRYDKRTDRVEPPEPLFGPDDALSYSYAEGWYFSGTLPNALYIESGAKLLRYDVEKKTSETVFDAQALLGTGNRILQSNSSDDDRVHSATLKQGSRNLGCVVYREDINDITYFPAQGSMDECQIDRGGKWLVIKENVDGVAGLDNRVIDVETLEERLLLDQDGAAGHSDMGHGYMIATDNYFNKPNTQRLWKFDNRNLRGTTVYHNNDWFVAAPDHITHTNSLPGLPPEEQFACGSSANVNNSAHANEIICFRLDGTGVDETLVVAPVMTNKNSSGGDFDYGKQPKGNLDVTGKYFVWSSNMASNRLDIFVVKVPDHLLLSQPVIEFDPRDTLFSNGFEQ
jgi:hypothetical protein